MSSANLETWLARSDAARPAPALGEGAGAGRRLAWIGAICGVIVVLAATVPIEGAVIGIGRVETAAKTRTIAHPAGGVVARLLVADGDRVRQGQLLMTFDNLATNAQAASSAQIVDQLLARRARLEAERVGASAVRFPTELAGAPAQRAIADESRLFSTRLSEFNQVARQLSTQSGQVEDEIGALSAQIEALRAQRELIEGERQSVQELWKKRLVTIGRVNQIERAAAQLDGDLLAARARVSAARGRQAELRQRGVELAQARRAEAGRDLTELSLALAQQDTQRVVSRQERLRTEIRAPVAGVVEKLLVEGPGELVTAGEPMMAIVPAGGRVLVEARVSPRDIDQIGVGHPASVVFTSFDRASTPQVTGKVAFVAASETIVRDTQESFYNIRIEVDQAELKRELPPIRIGMPAEVFVQTGARTLLAILLRPLADQLRRTFRSG